MTSKYEERVIEKIRNRAEIGLKKYGTTMARKDLSILEWLQHLQEELLDGAVYIERLQDDNGQLGNLDKEEE
tara:strand:- start:267 stop:482 length:216 start_codon:yes stop_codon:yes gene_type:complete